MAIAEIDAWINASGKFSEGVELFKKHGNNSVMLSLFQKLHNQSTREMLIEQLKKISAVKKQAATTVRQTSSPKKPIDEYDSLPEQVKKLIVEKNVLYKQFSNLHSRLMEYKVLSQAHSGPEMLVEYNNYLNEDQAGEAALQLLDLEDALRDLWKQIDHFNEHGKLPEKKKAEVKEFTTAQAVQRRNTLRTYLSRNPESENAESWRTEKDELERKYNL